MASITGADQDAPNVHKRPLEGSPDVNGGEKRMKAEFPSDDPSLDSLFAPLPFESKEGVSGHSFSVDAANDLDLPDFLADKPVTATSQQGDILVQSSAPSGGSRSATPSISTTKPVLNPFNEQRTAASTAPEPPSNGQAHGQMQGQYTQPPSNLSNVNSTNKSLDKSQPPQAGEASQGQSPLYNTQAQINVAPGYQKTPTSTFSNQQRATSNSAVASPSGFTSGIRFDPKKSFPMHASASSPAVPISGMGMGTNYGTVSNAQDKNKPEDPTKLNDALAAAGVDIQREEELLSTNYNRSALNLHQQQLANRQRQTYGSLNAFLHPYHVALFMNKTARENGVMQNFMVDPEMLEFMSSACKEWLSNIVAKTVAMAKHRRRGIPAFNSKSKPVGKQKVSPPSQRSELSKELRNLALKQKEMEERRVAKRALLGLEKSDELAPDSGNKAGAEETLHRAANATAAMMTMNSSRKKYSWMTSGAGNSGEESKTNGIKDASSKQSSLISSRGDNGLRYREIRTGNMISSKDLLGVLEDERVGTAKAVVKGYARLKD